eukprot:jgi/Psemu1/292162/fgenesh1_pg.937_\
MKHIENPMKTLRSENNCLTEQIESKIIAEAHNRHYILFRRKMRRKRSLFLGLVVAIIVAEVPTSSSFVEQFPNCRLARLRFPTTSVNRFDDYCNRSTVSTTQCKASRLNPQQDEGEEGGSTFESRRQSSGTNGGFENGNETNAPGQNNRNYRNDQEQDLTSSSGRWVQGEDVISTPDPIAPPSPDRAISIVSELKSNAALFAAFAYGSLNLPGTLTVSESKVTSVTTSLSISRPLPDSDLIRTFVVLDVCTLCLMITCVAASQLLIYRLTDGSYEDVDEYSSRENCFDDNTPSARKKKNSRDSALGRLVTTYRNEFTVARITFDLGLVTLLSAVGVRSLAIFDEDIVVPVAIVLGITAISLAVAYLTTYVEVFRTAENIPERPLFSIAFPFLSKGDEKESDDDEVDPDDNSLSQTIPQIFLPISLASVGLGLFFVFINGPVSSESNLSRLGPYDVTSGATKLKVVTERIDSEKVKLEAKAKSQRMEEQEQKRKKRAERRAAGASSTKPQAKKASEKAEAANKVKAEAESAKKKAAEEEAKKKAEVEAKRKAEEEAKKKAEVEAKKKADMEAKKKAEEEAKQKAEEEAKKKAENETKQKAEEGDRTKPEEVAKKRVEDEAKTKAEEEMIKRQIEEEAKNKAMEEANAAAEVKSKAEAAVEAAKKKTEEGTAASSTATTT